ncbi:MAG: branched-chain amino acid ABC transporter permease [Rhodospirillaceae bacterium]|nr:branched-chain amino acid ABC transporter permease [Rhodospirillaceae bacterium]
MPLPPRRWLDDPRRGGLAALALILAMLPLVLSNRFHFDVAIHVGLAAIAVIGLNLLIGYAGQISLGHAGFFGLGAYGSAVLSGTHGWPPLLALLASALAVATLAFLVGRPILRLRGHYLAMATLGMGLLIFMVITNERAITGGPDGMSVPGLSLFGYALGSRDKGAWYALVAVLLLVAVWLALNLIDSPVGRALRALHASEVAATVGGVDVAQHKLIVFVVSAVYASVAGSLSAHYGGFITPDAVGFLHSIELVTMVVLGGMASTYGAIVGAAVLVALPQFLTAFHDYEPVLLGAILIACMIFLRRGLLPGVLDLVRARRP